LRGLKTLAACAALTAAAFEPASAATFAKIATTKGDIVVELYPDKAPKTVENFLRYATDGHYDRTIIHRVVKGVLFQGGGYSRLYTERPPRPPIPYEGTNGLKNERGAIAMARRDKPDTASAQWFINLQDSPDLDHRVTDLGPIYGYAVFGRVVEGMDVADAIGAVETGSAGPFDAEVPVEMIFINRIDPVERP
jgi:peptidyl-prolyl cis-trans isomerase A (cyclophilin A)/peptidyl-prolyl cis-trans isomerase B (cyclophilin B)